MRSRRFTVVLLVSALAISMLSAVGTATAQGAEAEMVISGLRNPRGVTFDGSRLLVAEAGVGGDSEACFEGPEGTACYGETGAISAVNDAPNTAGAAAGDANRLVDGLPSVAPREDNPETPFNDVGTGALGPHDVRVAADGRIYFPIGLGADPAVRDDLENEGAAQAQAFATLHSVANNGSNLTEEADLGQFEADNNPAEGVVPTDTVDTNPYSVVIDGDEQLVTDAGGNDIVRVAADGSMSVAAVFPPLFAPAPPFIPAPPGTRLPTQPVPTGLDWGPDDLLYAGQLTGFPFPVGGASVWQLADGGLATHAAGFTNIIDVAWGPDDNLYVLEIAHASLLSGMTGALYRVTSAETKELIADDLFMPGGIAFGPDDMAYVTNCSVCTDEGPSPEMTGHVLRMDATGAPALATVSHDQATTTEDDQTTIDVTANDSDDVSLSRITDSGAGSATIVDGRILYQPAAHFTGADQVTYEACDADDHCATATVVVQVNGTATDRVAGPDRIETAIRTSRATFSGGANAVVIARHDEYADALAGAVLARAVAPPVGAPILLTPTGELDARVAAEINRLGATTAYVLGGEAAISEATEQAIAERTTVEQTARVAGQNRFETASAIMDLVADVTGQDIGRVYIAEGDDPDPNRGFADALSVSHLAAHQRSPILLVATDALPAATRDAVSGIGQVTIVGGTAAVSQGVQNEIDAVAGTVDRLAGQDRYETSRLVVQAAIDAGLSASTLWLATGANWPDALTAGPSVARDGGVLLLVHPTDLDASPSTRAFIDDREPFADVDLLGGTAAISTEVEQEIQAILTDEM